MSACGPRALALLSACAALLAVASLLLAVSTDWWLHAQELETHARNLSRRVRVSLHSGLWRVCTDMGVKRCSSIPGFESSEFAGSEATANFLRMVRNFTPFPLASLLLMSLGLLLNAVSHVRAHTSVLPLLSGVLFILSGLSLVLGLVLYISGVNDVHDEVRSRAGPAPLAFHYRYGVSFLLAGASFFLSEGAGVLCVYLFTRRYSGGGPRGAGGGMGGGMGGAGGMGGGAHRNRPRLSDGSNQSARMLHPPSPPPRSRTLSDSSSHLALPLAKGDEWGGERYVVDASAWGRGGGGGGGGVGRGGGRGGVGLAADAVVPVYVDEEWGEGRGLDEWGRGLESWGRGDGRGAEMLKCPEYSAVTSSPC
ncbi:voltage-dependent calcium channel gamma-5 subunit-like [Lampetra fluviatilis]